MRKGLVRLTGLAALGASMFLADPAFAVVLLGAVMVFWWMTEAVPLAVTALLPMLIFPLTGALQTEQVAMAYANPMVFLFFGGFLLAGALEKSKLHLRIALGILRFTGSGLHRVVLGFMAATWFLSMWLSNTATAVMMLPIALSVIQLSATHWEPAAVNRLSVALLLGLAYAANIGGMATLIGTPPNLVFAAYAAEHGYPVPDFAHWLGFGFPVSLLLVAVAWFLLTQWLFALPRGASPHIKEHLRAQWEDLGRMNAAQKRTALLFGLTALGWIFRPALVDLTGLEKLSDTSIALAGGILCFLVPDARGGTLLEWSDTRELPWGILLLFGGGLALAAGLQENGWINWLSEQLNATAGWPAWAGVGLMAGAGIYLTEFMSNMALVAVMMPAVDALASAMNVSFVSLALPLTLGASCAFMLPMATPPNAVVFASGKMRVWDMVKAGFWLNLVSLGVITLAGVLFFSA